MNVFRFILLTLTAVRFTRLLTTDDWPPTKSFREWVIFRTGQDSGWSTLIQCPWCASVYIVGAIYAVDHFLWTIPTILLAVTATMALVGYLGVYDQKEP